MTHDFAPIYAVIKRSNVIPLKQIAQQPGVQAAVRIVAYYADRRAHDSISTVTQYMTQPTLHYETVYNDFLNQQPIVRSIPRDDFLRLWAILQKIHFDHLTYPQRKLLHTDTLWSIERATAAFSHQVTLNPHENAKPYCYLINGIDGYLSDAVRELTRKGQHQA